MIIVSGLQTDINSSIFRITNPDKTARDQRTRLQQKISRRDIGIKKFASYESQSNYC
jgi:hypothetical protein